MRMKSTGLFPIEVVGDITELKPKDDWLILKVRTTTPTGWDLSTALTHQDMRTMLRLLLTPGNLRYLVAGLFKSTRGDPPTDY